MNRQIILGVNILKKPLCSWVKILLILLLVTLVGCSSSNDSRGISIPSDAVEATVKRVVDGDTFVLENDRKVRMIGINTPESVDPRREVEYYGKEASNYTRQLLEGQPVFLQWGTTPQDKYGRGLAWVWLPDGTFVNGHLVAEGYAQVYTFKDNPEHADYLLQLQNQAREEQKGLWKSEKANTPSSGDEANSNPQRNEDAGRAYIASKHSSVYHEQGCPGAEQIKQENLIFFDTEEAAQASGREMCQVHGCTIVYSN